MSERVEYYRGAKEAFQRVVKEWNVDLTRDKVQNWANNCDVYEEQHRQEAANAPAVPADRKDCPYCNDGKNEDGCPTHGPFYLNPVPVEASGDLSQQICRATSAVPIDHRKGENCPRCDAIQNVLAAQPSGIREKLWAAIKQCRDERGNENVYDFLNEYLPNELRKP